MTYIRVWHNLQGALDYHIEAQEQQAREMNAPANTIYVYGKTDVGPAMVATTDDIQNSNVRAQFERECERLKLPVPQWAEQIPF